MRQLKVKFESCINELCLRIVQEMQFVNSGKSQPHFCQCIRKQMAVRGHSESTFVEEGREGTGSLENKNEQREGAGCPSMCVRSLFLKKC